MDLKRALARPGAGSAEGLAPLQRMLGNRAVQRLLTAAEPEAQLQTQAKAARQSFAPGADFEQRLQANQGGGQPLPDNTLQSMENRFGADFSSVRLHTGAASAQLNREISAQAFTYGSDIYLGQGKEDVSSSAGQQLLAHELTHTLQQGAAQRLPVQRIVDSELEKLQALDAQLMGRQGQRVVRLLTDYNAHMHAGQRPGPEQSRQLKQAYDLLQAMVRALDKHNLAGPQQAARDTLRDVAIRLTAEMGELGRYREILNGRKLGKGQVNTVYSVLFAEGWEAVWKADSTSIEEGARGLGEMAGMPGTERANLGSRNIAMYRLDQLLGTGVIPRTERAMFGSHAGTVMERVRGRQLGATEFSEPNAEGQTHPIGSRALDVDYSNPEIQRGLSNLQLLDAIAGQFDRHAGNIMVEVNARGQIKGIKGIDNDFAFGVNMTANAPGRVSHERGLPRMVDIETAHNIVRVTPAMVRQALAGLLTSAEIESTVQRFQFAQSYCRALVQYFENPALAPAINAPIPAANETPEQAAAQGQVVFDWNAETEAANFGAAEARVNQAGNRKFAFARAAGRSYAWDAKSNLALQMGLAQRGDRTVKIETL